MKKVTCNLARFMLLALLSPITLAGAQTIQSPLEKLPYSASMLVARAIRAGRIQPQSANVQANGADLTCSKGTTGCVMPIATASPGGDVYPVNTVPLVLPHQSESILMTGANDYNCSSLLGFYITADTGTTWNHSCMNIAAGASFGDGSPIVGFDTHGVAYAGGIEGLSSGASEIVLQKSTNYGSTWGTAAVAVTPLFSGGVSDKGWLQIDTNAGSPFVNCIYISSTQFDTSKDSTIAVAHSCNGGSTWTNVQVDSLQTFPNNVDQFSDLTIRDDGTVFVSWMRCPANGKASDCGGTEASMLLSSSTDGGNTWSAAVVMAKVRLAPDTCRAFFGCVPNTSEPLSNIPAIGIDNSQREHRGYLYAVMYNYNLTAKQLQVQMLTSQNGGATWGSPVLASPGAINDEFFPWLTVNSVGKVGVTWLDRRNDSANVSYEAFSALCHNGGVAFEATQQLTTNLSNPNNDGFGGFFMGDYTGNFFQGPNIFTSWMDSSDGFIMQDVVGGFIVD